MRESNDVRRVEILTAMPEPELATMEANRLARAASRPWL